MNGTFNIRCRRRTDGSSAIGLQQVSAPWHLSKPYWDGKVLLVQAVNATAGIFAGDHLDMQVHIESGASMLLTSPSASRIHTMPKGEASLRQTLHVVSGGWLEWMPELFIPQRGCRYSQKTEIHIAKGASAYLVESLAPGRVAHGEAFAFDILRWSTRVWYDGNIVLSERFDLSPSTVSLHDLTAGGVNRYAANVLLVNESELPFQEWQKSVIGWNESTVMIGGTKLASDVYYFRVLCNSSEELKTTLRELRAMISTCVPLLRQSSRKL